MKYKPNWIQLFGNVKTRVFKLTQDKSQRRKILHISGKKIQLKFCASVESALVVLIHAPFGRDAECRSGFQSFKMCQKSFQERSKHYA